MAAKQIAIKNKYIKSNKEKIEKISPNILNYLSDKSNLKQIFNKKKSLKNYFIKEKIMKNVIERNKSITRNRKRTKSKILKMDEIDLIIHHLYNLNNINSYNQIYTFIKNSKREKCIRILHRLNYYPHKNAPLPLLKNILINLTFNDINIL